MAMVLGIIGGVIGAMGSLQEANATASAADYNKEVANRNRAATLEQTESAIADKRLENRRQMATLRASYGASGLELDGSPLDVLEDTATEQAYDVAKIRYQGRMKAEGYREQAALFKLESKSAKTAGYISAGAQLISGIQTGLRDWGGGGGGGGAEAADFS